MDNLEDYIRKAEELKKEIKTKVDEYNLRFSQLSTDAKKELATTHADISKLMRMALDGNIDENHVELLKRKYADQNSK